MAALGLAAAVVVAYQIDAALDPERRAIEGALRVEIVNPTRAPLDHLYLWLYPNRFARPPAALDDVNRWWIYPRGFDPGGIEVSADGLHVSVEDHPEAGPGTLGRVPLARPVEPGGRASLDLRFRTRIPRRYGPFGCAAGVCTLAGGWHPMVAHLDERGFDLAQRPARADAHVRVRAPPEWTLVLGGERRTDARLSATRQVALVAYQRFHFEARRCAGVDLVYASRFRPAPPSDARFPYGLENFYAIGLDAACRALAALDELGLAPAEGARLVLAEVPLRHEIAQPIVAAEGDLVLVSDRAWRLFPLERFRKFHTFQVARAVYAVLLARRLDGREDPRDLDWVADAVASYLVDLFTLSEYRRREFARDVLRYFGFVPAIDDLMYAPKVAFTSAYFGSVTDPDLWRDDLARFANDRPRGKRVYEKLRDLLGGRVVEVMRLVAREGLPMRAAAERVAGRELDGFFAQWLGPYPVGDVSIDAVESRDGSGPWLHHVRVSRRGEAVEPVVLLARDAEGAELRLRWEGDGAGHVYEFETRAPLDAVHLDPDERLVERRPGSLDDTRLDNRVPPRWKLIWNQPSGFLDVVRLAASIDVSLTLRRVYDLRNAFTFGLFRTPTTDVGGRVGYGRGFGVQADANRLAAGAGLGVSVGRLNENFAVAAGEPPRPGTRASAGASLGYDDRYWHIDPQDGRAASVAAGPTWTALDEGERLWTWSAGASATEIVGLGAGHALALRAGVGSVFGDVRVASQLAEAGLLGYEPGELLGRGAAGARVEYRHLFVQGLDWNVLHVARGRGIGGAVVLGAATVSSCEDWPRGWFTRDSFFFDAGYSLRGFFDHLGVSQAILRLDFAMPLVRRRRACLGQDVDPATRAPFGFLVVFAPPF